MNPLNKHKEYFHPILAQGDDRAPASWDDLHSRISALFGPAGFWTRVKHFAYDPAPNQLTAAMDVPANMRIIARWEHRPGIWAAIAVNSTPMNDMRLAAAEATVAMRNFGKAAGEVFRK